MSVEAVTRIADRARARTDRAPSTGALLLLTALVVVAASGRWHGTDVVGPVTGLLALGTTFAVARHLARAHPTVVPLVVAAGGVGFLLVTAISGDLFDRLVGPVGYANATASFALVVATAVLLVRHDVTAPLVRWFLAALAGVVLTVPILVGSLAGAALGVVVVVAATPIAARSSRFVVRAGAALVAAVVVATVSVAAVVPEPWLHIAPSSIGERVRLWREALVLIGAEPLTGTGLGRFGPAGTPARVPWERFAHQEYLHVTAELGVVGGVLLVAALVWLARELDARPGAATALGAGLVVALALHASIDYVTRFPAVTVTAAALVGAVIGRPRPTGIGHGTVGRSG